MSVLSDQTILNLIMEEELVTGFPGMLEDHVQPNGFDLSLGTVEVMLSNGILLQEAKELSPTKALEPDENGMYFLLPNRVYLITFIEAVKLPKDVMALTKPRSSLIRMGATIYSAIWDAGYHGRGQ